MATLLDVKPELVPLHLHFCIFLARENQHIRGEYQDSKKGSQE